MNRVFVVCLLLQAVYAERNISISIGSAGESPADVTYVDGKAPEDLKAGPAKNETKPREGRILHAAFIRDSSREIPKDDEIENEEFERFIKKHHNHPTIETVFVSSSPSPLIAEDFDEHNEKSSSSGSQVELFKRPADYRTFERSVALPTSDYQQTHTVINQQPLGSSINLAGGGASYAGNDGFILESGGGQYYTFTDGQYYPNYPGVYVGGGQPNFQVPTVVPAPGTVPSTINVPQQIVKAKTYEIRRPAIQKHYYDIEERVIIRPAGSIVVELNRPVAKIPTGETIIPVGGSRGGFSGFPTMQSVAIGGSQGGFGVGAGFQQTQTGGLQGSLSGAGFQQSSGGAIYSTTALQGGFTGTEYQQSQGGFVGSGIQQSEGGLSFSTTGTPSIPPATPTPTGAIGGSSGAGFQQSQGGTIYSTTGAPFNPGGFTGLGIQQSQGGVSFSTTGTPYLPPATPTPTGAIGGSSGSRSQQPQGGTIYSTTGAPLNQGGFVGIGYQQSQGGFAGSGIQQSQGGVSFSTTGTPYIPPATPTPTGAIGGSSGVGSQQPQGGTINQGGFVGTEYQQPQGGFVGSGIQQPQGGVSFSITGTPFIPPVTPAPTGATRGSSGAEFQQSQGGTIYSITGTPFNQGGFVGTEYQQPQGGFVGSGIQQPQGGVSFSITGTPFIPPATPTPTGAIGGSSGVGLQQSQGGTIYSTTRAPFNQGGFIGTEYQQSQGGFAGPGIQQSQGGLSFSTTGTPSIPPATPTPTGAIGGSSVAGFQQSQGSIAIAQGGSRGVFAGVGIQQSQGSVGVAQGGSGAGIAGVGLQQSQGGIIYSTTAAPSNLPAIPTSAYSGLSTTTAGSVFARPNQQNNNDNSVVVETSSNVRNRGTFSSTTTTERSFSNTVSQDASAFARGSSSGSIQAVSKNITPYMIAVGEPNFQYPPYVEINSNGSPLSHLQQQPYAQVRATSGSYPRMRYQGQLLTGESRNYEGLTQNQQGLFESSANVAEIPPNAPYEEQQSDVQQSSFAFQQPEEIQTNTQYQHQLVGSTQQPVQTSQISGGAHQQPTQIYQHNFVRTTSQPIQISEIHNTAHPSQVHNPIQYRSRTHQAYKVPEQPIYAPQSGQETRHQIGAQEQTHAAYASQKPNLVAQIRHQHIAQLTQQPNQVEAQVYQQHQQPIHQAQIRNNVAQNDVAEVTQHPIEVADIRSSTHRQYVEKPSKPILQYQQQVISTTHNPETFNTGRRLYPQSALPLKYTQPHTINVTPSQHTIFFSNQPQKLENSDQKQDLETPPEPHLARDEEAIGKNTDIESSTIAAAISSTASAPTPRQGEDAPQLQKQTYASVLANNKPGILYASPDPPKPRSHSHSQHVPRFNSEGSSLFSPSGRQLHLVYSQPSRVAYSEQKYSNAAPLSAESGRRYISLNNEGLKAQIPISQQRQIQFTANRNSGPASVLQKSRSQLLDESQQTAARYQAISSTTPETITNNANHQSRGQQKYRNEQTHGALTLRSGRTYGDHRVIASTPAPSDASAASESVQTRRIVVNHPFQTVQEVVEQEPITKFHQVTVNEPVQVHHDGLQQVQQNASYSKPAAYKVAATYNHPAVALSYRHGGSH